MMKRINWIDIGKTLAIYGVVLLHTHCDTELTKYLNGFLLPLFFIMSGYLFSYERNPHYGPFLKKRFRQLVVPYLWINAIAYIAWLTVLRHYGADADSGTAWYSPLTGIIAGVAPMLSHDIPLWSLLCFFIVESVFYPLYRRLKRAWLIAFAMCAASFLLSLAPLEMISRLPFTIGPAAAALVFYSLGFWLREKESGAKILSSYIALLVCIAVFIYSVTANSEVEFYICRYGNYGLYMLSSLSGSAAIIILSHKLGKLPSSRAIRFISDSTLIICGFHLLIFAAIKGIMLLGFGIVPDELTDGAVRGVLFSLTAFALTLPVAWAIRRYMRILVDK